MGEIFQFSWAVINILLAVLLIVLPVWLIIKINSLDKNLKKIVNILEKKENH